MHRNRLTALLKLAAATAAAIAAIAVIPAATASASTGAYLDIASWSNIDQQTVKGPDGVPQPRYNWGVEDNPVTVEQWALQHHAYFTQTHQQADLDAVLRGADWLLGRQQPDGTWLYDFEFISPAGQMHAPWISALAQGQAMSLLVRVYAVTHDQRYLDAALAALKPFSLPAGQGGVLGDWDGDPWYEEYPTPAMHILNGFEFTLVGLRDLAPYSPDAQQLYDAGIVSLEKHIGAFDVPSSRDQTYGGLATSRYLAGGSYPKLHAVLTRYLASSTGNQTLLDYANRWERYLQPLPPTAAPSAPAPAPVAEPASSPKPRAHHAHHWTCTLAGRQIRRNGHVACHRAKHVLSRAISGRKIKSKSWRCVGHRFVTCRRHHRDWVRVKRAPVRSSRTR